MRNSADMAQDDSTEDRPQTRNDAVKLARQVQVADIKWLMSIKQGRRFMARLLGESGIHRTSFTGNSETFFREGRRDLGLFFEAEITAHAFTDYILMLTEQKAPA